MAWNGSGLYERIHNWVVDAAASVNIEASRMDAEDDSIAGGINNCIAKNGENAATADLPMGTNKHTGVGDGSARTHYPSIGQFQDAALIYGTTAGTNTMTLTLSPAITAYAAGQRFFIKAGGTNTGATTININGVGAKNVFAGGLTCTGGEIQSGEVYCLVYDGTQFQLIGFAQRYVGCQVDRSSSVSIPDNSATAVQFNAENWDTNALHDTGSNPSRITIPTGYSGYWKIDIYIAWQSNITGFRIIQVNKGGAGGTTLHGSYVSRNPTTSDDTYMNISFMANLSAAEYIEIYVTQTSGGALNVLAGSGFAATFMGS